MATKLQRRQKIRYRIRKKIAGAAEKPRLAVFRSNAEIYVQLIDDQNGQTLASSSSKDKDIAVQKTNKVEKSKLVGAAIARKAIELGITATVNIENIIKPSPTGVGVVALSSNSLKKRVFSRYRNTQNVRNIKYASFNPVPGNNVISPISVTAPPIYDNNGNLIMDEDLVSAPNENYIIVTSPNGEQTKISRKFLKMLSVLNGGSHNSYMNAESSQWKIRFEEWRSKLQQASYIPTANNFLDIMDLKEMLQDN